MKTMTLVLLLSSVWCAGWSQQSPIRGEKDPPTYVATGRADGSNSRSFTVKSEPEKLKVLIDEIIERAISEIERNYRLDERIVIQKSKSWCLPAKVASNRDQASLRAALLMALKENSDQGLSEPFNSFARDLLDYRLKALAIYSRVAETASDAVELNGPRIDPAIDALMKGGPLSEEIEAFALRQARDVVQAAMAASGKLDDVLLNMIDWLAMNDLAPCSP